MGEWVPEGGGAVGRDVLMSLLETAVLLDVVEVVTADDDGSGHLRLQDYSGEDVSADGDVSGEGALLVDEGTLNSLKTGEYSRP